MSQCALNKATLKHLLILCFPVVCVCVRAQEETVILRPRLCHMRKGSSGYGFNLHSDKNKAGQFIRAVDEDSPAQRAGLQPKDKIIQVCNLQVLLVANPASAFLVFTAALISRNPVTSAGNGNPASGYRGGSGERRQVVAGYLVLFGWCLKKKRSIWLGVG